MNNYAQSLIIFFIISFFLFGFSKLAHSHSIEQLISENHLTIKLSVDESKQAIIKQPFLVNIEIATDRWFANGTQIKPFSLQNTVMLTDNVLSINGTKKVEGVTWVTQLKQVTLYPTKSGHFVLPEIEVFISVNTEKYGVVEGRVKTQAISFDVSQPPALNDLSDVVVSPEFSLNIESDFDENKNYKIGDAITQTVHFKAIEMPGMMFPVLTLAQPKGLSIYHKPPSIFDQSSRGVLIGNRIENYSYIIEQPGSFLIPEQKINWWDSKTNQLVVKSIPELSWHVGPLLATKNKNTFDFFTEVAVQNKVAVITITLLFLFLCYLYQHRIFLCYHYKKMVKYEQRSAAKAFLAAMDAQDYPLACQKLYNFVQVVNGATCSIKAFYFKSPESAADNLEKLARLYQLAGLAKNVEQVYFLSMDEAKMLVKTTNKKTPAKITLSNISLNK